MSKNEIATIDHVSWKAFLMYCYKQGRMLKRQLISLWYMPIMKLAE